MTDFEIGDDEYEETEEVNTSYDQDQPIGDEPQALNTELSNSEPIDAETGEDFYTVQIGGATNKIGEGQFPFDIEDPTVSADEKRVYWKLDRMEQPEHIDDLRRWASEWGEDENLVIKVFESFFGRYEGESYANESLNLDGTGVRKATRGVDPNKAKDQVLRFVYVSKSDCPICKPHDGHSWAVDSPNRPVIPRLESQKGNRPFTHPHCKCKWVNVFSDVESKSSEVNQADFDRTRKWYGAGFDKLTVIEQKMAMIEMLKQSLGMEVEAEEDIIDPVPIASMAKLAFDAITPTIKHKLGIEAFVEQEHPREEGGKFTAKGGGSTTAKNLSRAYPNLKPDFINQQLSKAGGLRTKAVDANQKIKQDLKQSHSNIKITGRIKSAGSMVGKLGRKPDLYSDVNDLSDVSGIRAIAQDLNGVTEIVDDLREKYDVLEEKDNIDESRGGYRSYHVIVKDKESGVTSEIQIRTKNQDAWAKWSWKNIYKPHTKKLQVFINSNKIAIAAYSMGMSKYFYEKDMGLNPNRPKCPHKVEKELGCLT